MTGPIIGHMTKDEILDGLSRLNETYGPWSYDLPLPYGIWTRGGTGAPHYRLKRTVQAAADLVGRPLCECRVLDLGCLEGLFAIEFAMQGCRALGIEAREGHVAKAAFAAKALGLDDVVSFERDDVRNISHAKYGEFDIIVCSGILYHLDVDGVFGIIAQMHDMTNRVVVIDTHVSLHATVTVNYHGCEYHGSMYKEHDANASQGQKERSGWASYDNVESLWLTRESLVNALSDAGFTSVHECFVPVCITKTAAGIALDRCTFAAVKGDRVQLLANPAANAPDEPIPEMLLRYA